MKVFAIQIFPVPRGIGEQQNQLEITSVKGADRRLMVATLFLLHVAQQHLLYQACQILTNDINKPYPFETKHSFLSPTHTGPVCTLKIQNFG